MRKTIICVALGTCSLLHGCGSSKVQMSGSTQQNLANQKNIYNATEERTAAEPSGGRMVDYAAETEVSEKSLTAWRLGLAGKVDEAMKILEDLDKSYPNMKTVSFMKGQVQEHAGHKDEALKYYKQAVVGNEFDAMELFKLAELERETGKTEQAIADYQKLLRLSPAFAPGQLGLAKALLKQEPKSAEAKQLLHQVVDGDPEGNEKSAKEAKELLKHFGVAVGSGKTAEVVSAGRTGFDIGSNSNSSSNSNLSSSSSSSSNSNSNSNSDSNSNSNSNSASPSPSSDFKADSILNSASASPAAARQAPMSSASVSRQPSRSASGSVSNVVAMPMASPSSNSASSRAFRPSVPVSSSSFSSPAAAQIVGSSNSQSPH